MKKLMSLTAALVLAAFMTTSCGLLSGASASATPSSSGTTTGSALYSLFTHQNGRAYMVFRLENEAPLLALLSRNGLSPASAEELDLK